ncbi:glycosyltransferase family 4 protein [Sporosarcina sp. YIM B06819]|uniref:glycosyltransferase family 4 protein n=1 Tax=Sporosarcina sp. YIM B06819 TaxID=3081769 RepID=UPI00298BE65C|nr:glycosyltransferase family 4 protein [Sporosarcina sp. YIM B06819]
MRIMMTRSNPVNPDPRVEKELNTLLERGYELKVLAWERNGGQDVKQRDNIALDNGQVQIELFHKEALFGRGIINLWSLLLFQLFLLKKLIHYRRDYDVIHACDFDTVIPAFVVSKIFHKKYVYDVFDYYVDAFRVPTILKPVIECLDIQMINQADAVIIVNDSRIEQMRKSVPKSLWIIHNSPDRLPLANGRFVPMGSANKKLKFVYVGVLSTSRFLLEIADVISKFKDAELHIGGFGDLESHFREQSAEHPNIFFYGKLDYDSVLTLAEHCDVMLAIYDPLVPNHRFTSPNKLYEAMLLKKPIIVAEHTGIDEIVAVNHTGFVIEYDKLSLTNLIEQLLQTSPNVFQEMGIRSHRLYSEKYAWSIMGERLTSLYEQL